MCNIGFIGQGKYSWKTHSLIAEVWSSMFQRSYSKKFHLKNPTYKNCSVDKRWHNFQNFATDYERMYPKNAIEKFHLDKDILVPGNKIYGPDTCCFVPKEINDLFRKNCALDPIKVKKLANKWKDFISPDCYQKLIEI